MNSKIKRVTVVETDEAGVTTAAVIHGRSSTKNKRAGG